MAAPCYFTTRDLATLRVITGGGLVPRPRDIRKRAATQHDTAK
jgi:hypothetical protein